MHSKPGLNGNRHRGGPKNIVQKRGKCKEVVKLSGPFFLGGYGGGRTAQVQVDLLVTHGMKLGSCPQEMRSTVCQQLRHDRKPGVLHWGNVTFLPSGKAVILIRREEGNKILVHAAKMFGVCAAENGIRQPLKRSEIKFHRQVILWLTESIDLFGHWLHRTFWRSPSTENLRQMVNKSIKYPRQGVFSVGDGRLLKAGFSA